MSRNFYKPGKPRRPGHKRPASARPAYSAPVREVFEVRIEKMVQCGEGTTLYLTEVQTEGGKRLSTSDFVRGKKISAGQRFGE